MTAKIYVEGGGPTRFDDEMVRRAWKAFFTKAGLERRTKVVKGGSRDETFDKFGRAIASPRDGEVPILLVDSEEPVSAGLSAWEHLRNRDRWTKPHGAADDQFFLMVQVMETWIVADIASLQEFFGNCFRPAHLPSRLDLEAVPKTDVFRALDRATAGCVKRYSKGKTSFELVGSLDPTVVEERCPSAKRLLDRLRSL